MRSSPKERVVRRMLKDGSIKEYRYAQGASRNRYPDGSVAALVAAYKLSPEYLKLSDRTKRNKGFYLRHVEKLGDKLVIEVSRGDWYELRDAINATRGTSAATCFSALSPHCLAGQLSAARSRITLWPARSS